MAARTRRTPASAAAREAMEEFVDALDGTRLAGFDTLTAAQLSALAAAVTASRRRHAENLRAATATALHHVPKLLRGPVRRIVGV